MNKISLFFGLLLSCSGILRGESARQQLDILQPDGLAATASLAGAPTNPVPAGRADDAAGDYEDKLVTMDKSLVFALDGDTIYYGDKTSEKLQLRIVGIDTPETAHYGAGKFKGQKSGPLARKYARSLISKAKKLQYLPVGTDKYGRTLAHIFTDNGLFAVHLIAKGLAYETISVHGDNGYPKLAEAILEAARLSPKPAFENPHDWREREWSDKKEQAELEKDLARARTAMEKPAIIFDDGDTIKYKGTTFRLLGFDTPEIIHKEDGIFEDQPYGKKAAALTKKLITQAETVEYLAGGKDLYGRTLAHVFVDGELLSVRVIKANLAYESVSKYGSAGFPGYARLTLDAFRSVPAPPFQNPMYWRAEHQVKP